jgi:hypothetical protein
MRDAAVGRDMGGAGIATGHVLAKLGRAWPGPLSPEQEESLEALCRKIHIAKRVTSRYGPRWTKDAHAGELNGLEWRLLIVVLIAYAAAQKPAHEAGRGRALKLLNAAFATLDLAQGKMDEPTHTAMTEGAEAMMRLMLEGSPA